ncbi:hypothetical protein [Methyloglobulus sp.]|uniref:hypothetical protein n=1 Tax=Methyloglobulus sp. TaxID=2518622 RepID=UPI0032B7DCB2
MPQASSWLLNLSGLKWCAELLPVFIASSTSVLEADENSIFNGGIAKRNDLQNREVHIWAKRHDALHLQLIAFVCCLDHFTGLVVVKIEQGRISSGAFLKTPEVKLHPNLHGRTKPSSYREPWYKAKTCRT